MHAISELFHQKINEKREESAVDIELWNARYAYGKITASAEEMHQESLEQYGGGYESDGDDYTLT